MIVVHDANLKITRLVLDYADDYPAQLDARGERWLRPPPRVPLPHIFIVTVGARRIAVLNGRYVEPQAVSIAH